ncbi:MAG: molecular chaperone DnaJ [Gemmatimonadales bacterium]|nr:MAG: molecular chaperone DnaJ [Gemmatimonadales bacterium]
MSDQDQIDHYEVLQVSPRADGETIERVFRHLAKRLHPDNTRSGDVERFSQLVASYRVLSDPETRARYDAGYDDLRRRSWQLFDQSAATSRVEADRRIRLGILTLLYQARRRDVDRPGVGELELERILDCPPEVLRFHLWYMKESGWLNRLDTGLLAISHHGVNRLHEEEIPWEKGVHRLNPAPITTPPRRERADNGGDPAGSADSTER